MMLIFVGCGDFMVLLVYIDKAPYCLERLLPGYPDYMVLLGEITTLLSGLYGIAWRNYYLVIRTI